VVKKLCGEQIPYQTPENFDDILPPNSAVCLGFFVLVVGFCFGFRIWNLGFSPSLSAPNDYRFTQSVLTFTPSARVFLNSARVFTSKCHNFSSKFFFLPLPIPPILPIFGHLGNLYHPNLHHLRTIWG
jgi:hypothetical protein